jgi:hypothetical protein
VSESSHKEGMGNVNAANLKPEEIEEFQLMSNCKLPLSP